MNSATGEYCFLGKALDNLGICHTPKETFLFDVRVADSIHQFEQDWNSLLPPGHWLSSSYGLLYEKSATSGISYRYVLVYQEQKPIMCFAFQLIRIRPENLRTQLKNKFIKYAAQVMLNLHDISLLVSGNVFKDRSASFYFIPSALSDTQATQLFTKALELVATKEGVSAIMLKDMENNAMLPSIGKLEKLEGDISMRMELDPSWTSLKNYQAALSKKYAARAKKILQAAKDLEVKELDLEEIEANKHLLHTLYKQVLKHQPFLFGELNENYFSTVKRQFGNAFCIKGLYLQGTLVAFFSTFSHDDELDVHYVGMEYTLNATYSLYFYIHFLVLEQAILQKKKWLYMGRTSLEAKAILGCTPVYNATYVHFRNSLAECVFGYFKKDIVESDNWKTRNPLKASQQVEVGEF